MLDSKILLESNYYDYYSFIDDAVNPDLSDLSFKDLIPEFSSLELGNKRMYLHQQKCYEALIKGKNVILKSGTGSGKTEAWLIYSLKHRIPTLAIYPTLALANDQIKRIDLYSEKTGLRSLALDANRREELIHEYGRSKLRTIITETDILVTNPALLMNEIKKIAKGKPALLSGFLNKLRLVMFDEIDFYTPREIALILGLIDIFKHITDSEFQIATLSAMIENPEELAAFYTKINGKETEIIEGKRFRVENRTYVILGKNIRRIWEKFKNHSIIKEKLSSEDQKAFEDFEYFRRNYYKFIEIANSLKIELGETDFDPTQLLANYVRDEHVTLVFTRSINKAEEIGRKLSSILSSEDIKCIATHHHLINKEERKKIEEGARTGKIKILISPRTLSQGIDIGTVGRIVHFGLPESLREFYQREGRKGRRTDLQFSETIIIPSGGWDRKLLTRGIEALYEWLRLPIEKIIINTENKYRILFEAILKFQSPKLKRALNDEEIKLLKDLRLVIGDELTERGKEVERKLQFYEFAPPYGINRILQLEEEKLYLPEISHVDLVEKFQPGCFDPSNEAIVISHNISGGPSRIVSAVVEEEIKWSKLTKRDEFLPALEEYEEAKYKWGETPDLIYDYMIGKLSSEVLCVVHPPREPFGKYYKIPNRVYWNIRSFRPRIKNIGDRTIVYYDRTKIEIPTATYGKYSDYTYGAFFELDPSEDTTSIRIGLAYLSIILRKTLKIPFDTILYDVGKFGDKKFFSLHEPNSAGLIFKLDWLEIKKIVEEYKPEIIDEILFEVVDEYTYSDFLAKDLNWDYAKNYALRALDYLLLKERLKIKFKSLEITIPRPSRALKYVSLDMIWLPLREELGRKSGLLCFACFDGENYENKSFFVEEGKVKNFEEAIMILSKFVDEDFKFLIFDFNSKKELINELYLKSLGFLLDSLSKENKIIDVRENVSKLLGIEIIPIEELETFMDVKREVNLNEVLFEMSNSQQKISQVRSIYWKNFTKFLEEKASKYIRDNCKSIMLLHLITQEMKK